VSEHSAEKDAGHGTNCVGCLMLAMVERAELAEAKLAATWGVLDRANALNPADFKTGQSHLPPAFREVDFKEAFRTVLDLLNDIEQASGYPTRVTSPESGRS
jgi:hypothetical protein